MFDNFCFFYDPDNISADKFYKYFDLKIKQVKKSYSTDMIFIFAWNEWAEGGYLEPDKKFNDNYLKSVKEALANNDELR